VRRAGVPGGHGDLGRANADYRPGEEVARMASVWITLLDISSSMAEGFSTTSAPGPLSEHGKWKNKLEAAKDLLIAQIADVHVQDVAVITFSSTAEKIFHGSRSEVSRAEGAIRDLRARGNTDLAAALSVVTTDPSFSAYDALSVLILTDGLSNRGDPGAAAREVISAFPFGRIDTILIDETPAGRTVAEVVSINGTVRTAFSSVRLGSALTLGRAEALNREIHGLTERRLELETELVVLQTGAPTPTLLTVTTPLRITASSLRNEIAPMVEALQEIQETADAASGTEYRGQVTSISQSSPVKISLAGLGDAVKLVLTQVIPWRREHARQMLRLKEEEADLENQRRRAQIAREHAEVERIDLENRQREFQLSQERLSLEGTLFELTRKALNVFDPEGVHLKQARNVHLQKLARAINALADSEIEFDASGPGFEPLSRQRRR